MKTLRTALVSCLGLILFAGQAGATWSIVVINTRTHEVAVGCATCIQNFDLVPRLPVVRAGIGVANIQMAGDVGGIRKPVIWAGFENHLTPAEILAEVRKLPSFSTLQLGIVSFDGPPSSFSGGAKLPSTCGVTGQVGDLVYAIQGNVMTGQVVCTAAEDALLGTDGDMVERLMAAMQAARAMGGDGRCSCARPNTWDCGAPPPNFTKSAHTAYMIVARVGDTDGVCTPALGCANGDYYLLKNFPGAVSDPDPVIALQVLVDTWRKKQAGRPDHLLSVVEVDRQQLVADGLSRALVTVQLRDVDDAPLTHGGDILVVTQTSQGPAVAIPGPVTDNGDGTYTFEFVATQNAGRGAWTIVVDFGKPAPRQLYPPLVLESVPLTDLHAGFYEYSVERGGAVPFSINRGAGEAGRAYHLLGTLSGTSPGVTIGGVLVPLNRDRLFEHTWLRPGPPTLPGSAGVLDGNGWAGAWLDMPAASWSVLVGERMDFCVLLGGPNGGVTVVDGFPIVP